MNKKIWIVIILAIIIVILAGVLIFLPKKANNTQKPVVFEGIQIISPKENEIIASPLKISGTINGGGWSCFEGQVGTVKLLDNKGKQLGETAILTAVTDCLTAKVDFETALNFVSTEAQNGTLVFSNENASGLEENDRQFAVPVKIPKTGDFVSLKVFFNNNKLDPAISCNKVFATDRQVPKTDAVARAALEELLKGPTDAEKTAGFSTSINTGVKIQSLTITSGVAKVDFNEQLQAGVGGSCKISAIRAEITQTLKQFPTVKSVIISINGKTEDILQP
jgi:spore germination protein GerM